MVRKHISAFHLSVFACAFLSCIGAAIFAVAQVPTYCTAATPQLSDIYGGDSYPTGNPNTRNYQVCTDCKITCSSGAQSGCNICIYSTLFNNTAGMEVADDWSSLSSGYQPCDTTRTTTFTTYCSNVNVGSDYTIKILMYPYIPGPGAVGCQGQGNDESEGTEKSLEFTVPD